MRLIEILPPYEVRIFDNPPILSSDDQTYYFKIDETVRELLKGIKEEHNKIGLLLQYGYFKASGNFICKLSSNLPMLNLLLELLEVLSAKMMLHH